MRAFFDFLKHHQIEFIDFRFTDIRGTWHHMTYPTSAADEDLCMNGILFDGSSSAGWCAINESDMLLKPDFGADLSDVRLDPFSSYPTAIVVCDVYHPQSGKPYEKDPSQVAKNCMKYLQSTGLADEAFFGPEAEFFIFDGVRFQACAEKTFYELQSDEFPSQNGASFEKDLIQNHGYRPGPKGGYFPVQPVDSVQDMRSEMLLKLAEMGLKAEKHHHEVAPAQHELGIVFNTLVRIADELQIYKYVVRNVAHLYGKTATFMPKPVFGDNGSGMHVHQSLWKGSQPLFSGDKYAGLSETALFYIGGILKHAKSLNAFTNPTTNSYKRLVPGYEAPVICAYSAQNRSAACRIPVVSSPKAKRVEVRFPDATANPYLAFSAMLLAGLDGIQNKIHPGDSHDIDLFEEKDVAKKLPTVSGSLCESLKALENDHEYLTKGNVFSKELIESHLEMKWKEHYRLAHHPHPLEFELYYNS
jgi:glutamine synthetase